ncbi:hypothetical protein M0811_10225 [Anaeramoeba ignava]|uniref:MARVEL domain-containing protein n=1 Tax=Anaeramoeba ignava TaxID=1746090 RepID=A0A9Q0R9N4_ANAIG|nr:hypothetical protein M0811_10225 [Anaeramoeba ignava]
MSSDFWCVFGCSTLICAAVVVPSLSVASLDKDLDCPQNLWIWIIICNIFLILLTYIPLFLFFAYKNKQIIPFIGAFFISSFLLIWSIIGFVWASKNGVKNECGRLFGITIADGVISLVFSSLLSFFSFLYYMCLNPTA